MSLPIRCFTCGSVIGHKEEKFIIMLEQSLEMKDILNKLDVKLHCCRRMFLGYVNDNNKLLHFPDTIDSHEERNSDL